MLPEAPAAPAVDAPAPATPAAAPAATTSSLKDAGTKGFDRLNKPAAEAPKEPEPEAPPAKVGDETPNGNGELAPEAKKLLDAALAQGKYIPKERLDEVISKLKAFEDFGTVEDLAKMKKFFFERMARDGKEPEQPKSDPVAELSEDEKEFRNLFLKVFPEFKTVQDKAEDYSKFKENFEKGVQSQKEAHQRRQEALVKSGTEQITVWAKEAGIKSDNPAVLGAALNGVGAFLEADKDLEEGFYGKGDMGSLKKAFDLYFKEVFEPFKTQSQRSDKAKLLDDKTSKDKLPKAPAGGTPPAPEAQVKPKSLAQAKESAWARLQAAGAGK